MEAANPPPPPDNIFCGGFWHLWSVVLSLTLQCWDKKRKTREKYVICAAFVSAHWLLNDVLIQKKALHLCAGHSTVIQYMNSFSAIGSNSQHHARVPLATFVNIDATSTALNFIHIGSSQTLWKFFWIKFQKKYMYSAGRYISNNICMALKELNNKYQDQQ